MKYLTSWNGISAIKRTFVVTLCLILSSAMLAPAYAKILTTPDGGRYVGDVANGIPNGEGTFAYSDGAKYVGEWKDDLFHGQGSLTEPDGAQYVGEFKDDLFHGQGTYRWSDKDQYVGGFKEGQPHGQGTYTFFDGRETLGEWKSGKPWNAVTFDPSDRPITSYKNGVQHADPIKQAKLIEIRIHARLTGSETNAGDFLGVLPGAVKASDRFL